MRLGVKRLRSERPEPEFTISMRSHWNGKDAGELHERVAAFADLYVCARFGFEIAGLAGAITPLVLFGCIEAFLVRATRPILP